MAMVEIWKQIPGWEGMYEVSNLGNVRSMTRQVNHRTSGKTTLNGKILSPAKSNSGYLYVNLHINSKPTRINIHRLVCLAFLDNPHGKEQVNHKNGIKIDNRLVNLEWSTRSENTLHSYYVIGGRRKGDIKGKNNSRAKQVSQFSMDGKHIRDFDSVSDVYRFFGVKTNVIACCKGRANQTKGFKWRYKNG